MAVGFTEFDEEKERERLRKVSDQELIREGRAARYMCSPAANFGKPLGDVYVIALRLCRENISSIIPRREKLYRYPRPENTLKR